MDGYLVKGKDLCKKWNSKYEQLTSPWQLLRRFRASSIVKPLKTSCCQTYSFYFVKLLFCQTCFKSIWYLKEAPFTFTISSASWNLPSLKVMALINKSTPHGKETERQNFKRKHVSDQWLTMSVKRTTNRSYRWQFGEIERDEWWESRRHFDTLLGTCCTCTCTRLYQIVPECTRWY